MKVIVYDNPETGTVSVIKPTKQWLADGHKLEELLNQVPLGLPYRIVEESALPESRLFRNAWTDRFDTETVDVDLDRAKLLHLDKLRKHRNIALNKEDINYQIALEKNDAENMEKIAQFKQQLRDMPELAELEMQLIDSVDALSIYMPEILRD